MVDNREKWLMFLGVMSEHMPKVKIVQSVLDKMLNHGLDVPTANQQATLLRLYEGSYSIKKMDTELARLQQQQEVKDYGKTMNNKLTESIPQQLHVNTSPAEIVRYKDNKRVAIGFKSSYVSTPLVNSYNLDNDMKYKTKLEKFDDIFGDL
jgi:hypothetical protein